MPAASMHRTRPRSSVTLCRRTKGESHASKSFSRPRISSIASGCWLAVAASMFIGFKIVVVIKNLQGYRRGSNMLNLYTQTGVPAQQHCAPPYGFKLMRHFEGIERTVKGSDFLQKCAQ